MSKTFAGTVFVVVQYQRAADISFDSFLACSLVILVFLGGVQLKPKPSTFPVEDIAMMMMKQPNHHNSNLMASMYGGVITPLALVHQQIRQQNHQQQMDGPLVQLSPVGRSNSGE